MAILPAESGIWREIVITGDLVQVGRLQDDVERELIFCQFAAKEVFSIKLAVQEAVVNAIKHGNRMDPEKKVFIRYRISSERFDIHVIDEGRGFNPDEVRQVRAWRRAIKSLRRLQGKKDLMTYPGGVNPPLGRCQTPFGKLIPRKSFALM